MADHHRPLVPMPRSARQAPESVPRQSPRPKRNNIGSACSACKARKLKCSGNPPCQNCLKARVECTVDRSNDKRRKSVIKRKLEDLEDRKDLLLNLIRTIRDGGDRRTLQLLELVRNNASLTEIKFYLNDDHNDRLHAEPGYEKEKAPEISEMHSGFHLTRPSDSPSTEARNAFDPQSLVDIPLFDLPASPWTTVVQDAEMVSRLVSLWFTWFHPFLNWLDRDLFLRDMKSGDLKAQFCSPILVNAMLAVACTHSNCASVYPVPGDMASKGAHFYYEAKRLLENEEGRISLPTVQGLGLLAAFAGIAGKDRHGWIYQSHLVYAVHELSQQNRFPYSTGSADMYKRSPQVDHSIWGLFNIATIKAMLHQKQPPIKPPVQHYPPPPLHAEHFWRPYPLQLEGIKVHTDCLFHAVCELNRIVYDLGSTFFNFEKRLHHTELELKRDKLRVRLQGWADQLPSCLKDSERIQVPHLLSLHMYYYSICITLDQYAPSIKLNLDLDTNNGFDTRLSNARRISYLMRIHRSSWGIDRIPNCDAFVNLAVAAKAFSRRWVLGRVKLEQVHQQAQKMGVDLPSETKPLFSDLGVTSGKRAKLE